MWLWLELTVWCGSSWWLFGANNSSVSVDERLLWMWFRRKMELAQLEVQVQVVNASSRWTRARFGCDRDRVSTGDVTCQCQCHCTDSLRPHHFSTRLAQAFTLFTLMRLSSFLSIRSTLYELASWGKYSPLYVEDYIHRAGLGDGEGPKNEQVSHFFLLGQCWSFQPLSPPYYLIPSEGHIISPTLELYWRHLTIFI